MLALERLVLCRELRNYTKDINTPYVENAECMGLKLEVRTHFSDWAIMGLRGLNYPNIQSRGFPFGCSEFTADHRSGHILAGFAALARLGQKHEGPSTVNIWISDVSVLLTVKRRFLICLPLHHPNNRLEIIVICYSPFFQSVFKNYSLLETILSGGGGNMYCSCTSKVTPKGCGF